MIGNARDRENVCDIESKQGLLTERERKEERRNKKKKHRGRNNSSK